MIRGNSVGGGEASRPCHTQGRGSGGGGRGGERLTGGVEKWAGLSTGTFAPQGEKFSTGYPQLLVSCQVR